MAHIFKHHSGKSKGIVVFTHKEIEYFVKTSPQRFSYMPRLSRVFQKFKELFTAAYSQKKQNPTQNNYYINKINKIRKDYFIGVHYGWFRESVKAPPFIDFYMASESTVKKIEGNHFRIPLQSRNFTPLVFSKQNLECKYWDIICVSRNARFKHLDIFLNEIRKIYDLGYQHKVLLIVPSRQAERRKSHLVEIAELYYENFSLEERELFTLLRLGSDLKFSGLSQTQLAFFYNLSKVFVLFSEVEGESRVVHEALLCGLTIVVKENLTGGGRDYLDETNTVFFKDYSDAHKALIYAVDNYEKYNLDQQKLIEELRQDKSLERLKKYFSRLYKFHGDRFDGKLINTDQLNRRLPGHLTEGIPWSTGIHQTSDIKSVSQFEKFLSALSNSY